MATTEPVETPVQSEENTDKTTPVKEVKQNGQDGSPPSDVAVEKKEEAVEEAVDNHEGEEEKEGDETDKGVKKEEAEEKNDGDESEEEESSDDEPQVGSLDGPVQIMTGKRERKKVERLSMQSPPEKEKEKFEIKEGRGIKLGDCPMVEFQLNKTNADVLKPLYRVLFGRTGKISEIKRHIRKFSGFPFTKEDTVEYEKKETQLNRFTLGGLKELCTWLNLEKSGTKEDIVQRILEYCLNPVMSKKKPPVKKKKVAKKAGKKRKKVTAKGDAKKKKKSTKKKPTEEDDVDEDDDDDDDVVDDEDDDVDDQDEDSEVEEPKKKKAKKETPKPAKKTKAKTPQKKTSPKKSPTKKTAAKRGGGDDDSSDDDAPLSKKSKSPPSESEMRTVIKNFLDGANLEQVTMKTVCKKVYETYPEFDLTHKKDFIKSTVKEIISS